VVLERVSGTGIGANPPGVNPVGDGGEKIYILVKE